MDFETTHLRSMTGEGGFLQIYPAADMQEGQTAPLQHMPTLGGPVHAHRLRRGTMQWTMPLDFVSSADRATLVDWWETQQELTVTFVLSGTNTTTARVRLANEREPLSTRVSNQQSYFQGTIFLQGTTGDGKLQGGPFILDDATWGRLDQNYNILV